MPVALGRHFIVVGVAAVVTGLALWAAPLHPQFAALSSAVSLALLSVPPFLARGLLFVGLFTRIGRDDLLDAGHRPQILSLLRAEPGLGITDICQRLSIGWGTAVHHLTRLEAAGLVLSQDAGRHRRFFLPSESLARRVAVCILSTDLNRRLLEHIRTHPGDSQGQTCAALGISAPLAHKYLTKLIERGLVVSRRTWRTVQYYPGADVDAALAEFAQLRSPPRPEGPSPPAGPKAEGLVHPS